MINRLDLFVPITIVIVGMMISPSADSTFAAEGRTQLPHQPMVNKYTLQSETLQIGQKLQGASHCPPARFPSEFRTIDGTHNNCGHPEWGSAPIELLRLTKVGYDDGHEAPYDDHRPNVRDISNIVADQGEKDISYKKGHKYSDFLWQWGQFVDHDIDLTPGAVPLESYDIEIPYGDKYFDPQSTGTQKMPLERSLYIKVDGVRQQMNIITAFIDASTVYGSDPIRAEALRAFNGKGYLKTSADHLPPYNETGLPNAPGGPDPEKFFLVGDFRGNEQVALTAMHTLFVREHNYWADYFSKENPSFSDEALYQRARAMVGAIIQHITYRHFLPLLLGKNALSPYKGYKPNVNPGIANVFATAGYRFGHSMVASTFRRLNNKGQSVGDLPLRMAFFNPAEIASRGIDELLRGLASQVAQRCDIYIVDDLRNYLFGAPGEGGFDLASLNLQRGREHGLPNFNQVRKDFKLPPVKKFSQINRNRTVKKRLKAAYGNVKHIDIWIGGLAERPVPGAVVGKTVLYILKDQFERLRDGDRFWYETYLPKDLLKKVKKQTLAKIIKRNTNINKGEIQKNVFLVH